jgi:nucleosome assembly protein 1-like 1
VLLGEKDDEDEEKTDIKGIPGFWLTCLTSHPTIGELITEEDVPAIEHLTDITCDYDETFTSFTLTFHFSENEFFSNSVRDCSLLSA